MNTRNNLSANGLIKNISSYFSLIKETRNKILISQHDALMSAFAMFSLKYPSLLSFNNSMNVKTVESKNLKSIYHIKEVPSDTQMRVILDDIPPLEIKKMFKKIFSYIQRGKVLEDFKYLSGSYLCSIDGTGYFSSYKVNCNSCLEKKKRDGRVLYEHQMLSAVIAHPGKKEVIPIGNEPIVKQDGRGKNDCEINASKRLLADLRREHPHLNTTIIADGLFSKGPIVKLLKELNFHYILVCKRSDHKNLFDGVDEDLLKRVVSFEIKEEDTIHKFRFVNGTILNYTHLDMSVNFLEYWEIKKNKTNHWAWITDYKISKENALEISKGGRARWKIENETFNTLKNQDYHFEHNFGHGYKNLSVNFALLMMLAFMVDQTQQLSCNIFKKALEKKLYKKYLWEDIRVKFKTFRINSYEDILKSIVFGYKEPVLEINTS